MKQIQLRAAIAVALAGVSGWAVGGPEKVPFPADYLRGEQYGTVDRPDIKQFRVLYTQPEVIAAVRKGKGVPDGAVITMVQWGVDTDPKGDPVKDSAGRFVKKDIVGYAVMKKAKGFGAEYPDAFRNGEWEYSAFFPNGEFNPKANLRACFDCHKPHDKQDFVISLAALEGKAPVGPIRVQAAPVNETAIEGFRFNPAAITAAVGRAVTWRNRDDSPHQISVVGQTLRSGVMQKGQTASLTFDKAGKYDYICGLHPTMKGTIEVR